MQKYHEGVNGGDRNEFECARGAAATVCVRMLSGGLLLMFLSTLMCSGLPSFEDESEFARTFEWRAQ